MFAGLTALCFSQLAAPAFAKPGLVGLHALAAHTRFDPNTRHFGYLDDPGTKAASLPLTFDPELQAALQRLLDSYQMPLAQLVAIEPGSGRVLAAVESRSNDPIANGLAEAGVFPAASVFKVVTASALLARGLDPDDQVCFHGGKHRIQSRELADDERRDRHCDTLSEALAHSANVAIAKLAGRNLDPLWLRDWASRLLFDAPVPSDWPCSPSWAHIPDEAFGFAQTAAGFGDVRLGAFHGAALAAAIANHGELPPLKVFEDQLPRALAPPAGAEPVAQAAARRLMPEGMAVDLASMMQGTVSEGTARRAFHFRGDKLLEAAGKTGSISEHAPFRDYSWFVGFAPASAPRIALATVVVNGPRWRVHAATLAAAAIRSYLAKASRRQLTAQR